MSGRETMYVNGYDAEDERKINQITQPWRRSFIKNFYCQLQKKKNVSKKYVCDYIVNNPNDRLDSNYRLNPNTLSQYTNYNSKNLHPISVDGLIAVSSALNVSINYLLGIDSCENPENTSIHQLLKLTNDSIDVLKKNIELQEMLDIFLQSPHLNEIISNISSIFYSEYISKDILYAYTDDLRNILITAFNKYEASTLPIERSPARYKHILVNEIPLKSISPISDYLSENLSSDRYQQIMHLSPNSDDKTIYNSFINDTISCIFDTLSYKGKSDYYKHALFNSFTMLINDYIEIKASNLKYSLYRMAKETS